jgi:hypothetical protein
MGNCEFALLFSYIVKAAVNSSGSDALVEVVTFPIYSAGAFFESLSG